MTGTVYLRTNQFEVKLEGITFKTRDFESLCKMDFLFSNGKSWDRAPIVGLDVMRHPRDPSVLLLLLCFGVGCVILRFSEGESLSAPIHRFLSDRRIRFVGFGIPEKRGLLPFEEMGLTRKEVDIGYLATRVFKDPKFKRAGLADLARKVLGIKKMIGFTDATSFGRHEQIKSAICQLFITSVVGMGLLEADDRKNFDYPAKKILNANFLQLLVDGWYSIGKGKQEAQDYMTAHIGQMGDVLTHNAIGTGKKGGGGRIRIGIGNPFSSCFFSREAPGTDSEDLSISKIRQRGINAVDIADFRQQHRKDQSGEESSDAGSSGKDIQSPKSSSAAKKPVKGILKCPSTALNRSNSIASPSSPSTPKGPAIVAGLRRANSKGFNVSFKDSSI